jgi:uncharacterized protein
MKTIGGLFGRSPWGPVHEMMAKVQQCVERIPLLVKHHAGREWEQLEGASGELDRLEGQADDIKREIRAHLSTSLFSSVERSEILDILHCMDSIADACQDTGKLMCMRRTELPAELAGGFAHLGELLVDAAGRMVEVTAKISGARDGKVTRLSVQELITELEAVGRLEFESDEEQHRIQRELFTMEDRISTMDIFFLMNIIRKLGQIADEMENAADNLATILGSR